MGRLDDPDYYYKKRLSQQRKIFKTEMPRYIMQNGVLYERKDCVCYEHKEKPIKQADTEIKVVENIMVSFK